MPADAICTTGADETFGPLLVIEAFDDTATALRDAQDTPYGLTASIMTRDRARGLQMAARFDSGIVHVNGPTMAGEAALPVGGVKQRTRQVPVLGSNAARCLRDADSLREPPCVAMTAGTKL